MKPKYIFIAGAPGSKWSSMCKNIYYSSSIDRSDYSDERTYYHDASGKLDLMHLGAYFDPGMEFGDWFDRLDEHTKEECEAEFDRPFNGNGIRIIKSHVFAHHIDFLKKHWPECPVILVHRENDSCLGWWVRCGYFNITYPKYDKYYVDLRSMGKIIDNQNYDIMDAWYRYDGLIARTNREVIELLGIEPAPSQYEQNYEVSDMKVKII